jgi:threonine/homoserine/homoserine lactone efflux protein
VASGLGAASADLTYGLVVAFGLTAVTDPLAEHQRPLRVVGAVLLIVIAVATLRASAPDPAAAVTDARTLGKAYLSTFGLTLTNPATILTFLALFTSLGIVDAAGSTAEATVLVVGVGLGSALWWLLLATAVAWLRARVSLRALRAVNVVSAVVLGGFGVLALAAAA